MKAIAQFWMVATQRHAELWQLFVQHMQMTSSAVLLSLVVGVPLGIIITRHKKLASVVIGLANITQSIPSLGLLAILVPIVGIGQPAAVIMVIIYALLPIIKNTYVGVRSINPSIMKAAEGIGMSSGQILRNVQLPLAVPYIMSGVRISAVTAVGTVTIGAFAGAGGLGWMINLGLNANDVNLVLLGAIPACLLALALDFVLGMVEQALTPEGILPASVGSTPASKRRAHRIMRHVAAAVAVTISLIVPCASSIVSAIGNDPDDTVTVGAENFTEAIILGNIYSQLIQHKTNLKVNEKFNLDGTLVTMAAFDAGTIDTFTDYTGVITANVLKKKLSTDTAKVYRQVRDGMAESHQATVSKPLGSTNDYVLAMTKDTSRRMGVTKLSQLIAQSGSLRLGCTTAFSQRSDLLPKMEKQGADFASVNGLEGNVRYQALTSGKIDVTDAYSTDAMVKKLNLQLIEDDIHFFPPYQAISITRNAVLRKHPELKTVISSLDGVLDNDSMMNMNYQVDVEGKTAKEVAIKFLQEKNLI